MDSWKDFVEQCGQQKIGDLKTYDRVLQHFHLYYALDAAGEITKFGEPTLSTILTNVQLSNTQTELILNELREIVKNQEDILKNQQTCIDLEKRLRNLEEERSKKSWWRFF